MTPEYEEQRRREGASRHTGRAQGAVVELSPSGGLESGLEIRAPHVELMPRLDVLIGPIGRDLLESYRFTYDGRKHQFMMSY